MLNEIDRAEVFIGFIDGLRLYKYLKGIDSASDKVFLRDLSKICLTMDREGQNGRQRPAHLIITKWDILSSEFKFLSVKSKIMEIDFVQNFARSRQAKTRLIPVSAVGPGFVRLASDGNMEKVPGVRPMPTGVEWPMACLLPDLVAQEIERAKAISSRKLSSKIRKWLGFGLKSGPDLVEYIPAKYRIIARPIAKILAKAGDHIDQNVVKIEKEIDALQHISERMLICQYQLDLHFGKNATIL